MESLEDKIIAVQLDMALRKKIHLQIKVVSKKLQQKHGEVDQLKITVQDELNDLYALGNTTFRGLFHALMKNKGEQLEIERQEHLTALINLEKAKKEKRALKYQLKLLNSKYLSLATLDEKLAALLSQKAKVLRKEDKEFRLILNEFKIRSKFLDMNLKELDEAYDAGKKALGQYAHLLKELKHIKKWGGKVYGGVDKTASYKKRQFIERTVEDSLTAHTLTKTFMREGADLDDDFRKRYHYDYSYYENFVNVFISEVVQSFSVQKNLKHAIKYLDIHIEKIKQYLSGLEEGKNSLERRRRRISKERDQAVLAYNRNP